MNYQNTEEQIQFLQMGALQMILCTSQKCIYIYIYIYIYVNTYIYIYIYINETNKRLVVHRPGASKPRFSGRGVFSSARHLCMISTSWLPNSSRP